MRRHEARARWEALANAEFDRELLLWLANVAGEPQEGAGKDGWDVDSAACGSRCTN